jgi:hypothetical protein
MRGANVQLTFQENDKNTIRGGACVRWEPDIDHYKECQPWRLL